METLKQRRGFETRSFSLTPSSLNVEYKTIREVVKKTVRLDEIGIRIQFQGDNIMVGKVLTIIFSIVPFVTLLLYFLFPKIIDTQIMFWTILFCLFFVGISIAKNHRDDVVITGGAENIFFYRKKPREEAVMEFIEQILAASKKYKRFKHANLNLDVSEEIFIEKLRWLIHEEVITDAEFNELKAEYDLKSLL